MHWKKYKRDNRRLEEMPGMLVFNKLENIYVTAILHTVQYNMENKDRCIHTQLCPFLIQVPSRAQNLVQMW